jgi:hypothetical protein
MMSHRFFIKRVEGELFNPIGSGDTVTLALQGFSGKEQLSCCLVRQEDDRVFSWYEGGSWFPDPFACADGWQLAQPPIMDLRLHILARVPTIPVEHHVEAAALAHRVIAAVGEGTVELSGFENEHILAELPHYTSEDTSIARAVHCLRLLGHLPKDHSLVEVAMRDIEGVTPLVNNGAAILYEASPDWLKGVIEFRINMSDESGLSMVEGSYRMYEEDSEARDVIDGFLSVHPGAVCLALKSTEIIEHVAEPSGRVWETDTGGERMFFGKDSRGHLGFSILRFDGERWDVLDPKGSFVAGGILDAPTARCIAINHCLSGEKTYRGR